MPATEDSSRVLTELVGATDRAVETLAARATAGLDIEQQFAEIQKKFEQAAALADQRERELRMKVLEAEFQELRKDAAREEQDLAQAVLGLNALLENMGAEYANLTRLDAYEQALIDGAEKSLTGAQLGVQRAQRKWFFRDSAVAKAQLALQKSEQQLEQAKSEARRLARQRLLHADMEASLQEFMLRVEKTIQIMQIRQKEIEAQLKSVSARKEKAFQVREEAAKALEQLDGQLNGKEADLKREEELLQSFENGTAEYAAQAKKISDLRAQVEDLRGRRNTAFVLHQSKEKFAAELEIHERTQMKLRDNQRMWITTLRSDTEERVVTFRSRLEAMKAAADQEVAKNLDELGSEADQRNAEYMARVGAASDRLRMEKLEKHPERMGRIAAAAAAQAEAIQQIRVREREAIEKFKELYGIDPTQSSFFHYEGGGQQEGRKDKEKEKEEVGVF